MKNHTKKCIISSVIILTAILAHGQRFLSEDFAPYNTGFWPAPWAQGANASDDPLHNRIESNPAGGDSQTLRLFGATGGCWASRAFLPFNYQDSFEVEFDVYNGNEVLSGCHPDRASAGLSQGVSLQSPTRALVEFLGDGTIRSHGQWLQTYQTLQWYHVKVSYLRSDTTVRQSYWIDGVPVGSTTTTVIHSRETALNHFMFNVQEGSAWFANLSATLSPHGYVRHNQLDWMFDGGNGWHHRNGFGWMWFQPGGPWIRSSALAGWLAVTDPNARTVWSTQFRWLTPSATDAFVADTTSIGQIHIGQYRGAPITEGWVVSDRFGYVWAAGDGAWFYSTAYGWLGVTPEGGIWCMEQGRFL